MTTTNWIRGEVLAADDLDNAFGRCIDRAGDVMNGEFTLAADPVKALDAVTKQYVDNRFATYNPPGVQAFNGRVGSVNLLNTDVSGVGGALTSGFTMTGPVTLAGNPTAPLQPVTLQYFQSASPGGTSVTPLMDGTATIGVATTWAHGDHVHPSDINKLSVSGGTMGGPLTLAADPTTNLMAATKEYVDTAVSSISHYMGTWHVAANTPNITPPYPGIANGSYFICATANPSVAEAPPGGIPINPAVSLIYNGDILTWNAPNNRYDYLAGSSLTKSQADTLYVNKTGDTMTGFLTLNADPTANLQAATKQYVDNHGANMGNASPIMDGVAAPGTSPAASRQDHVHPSDTSRLAVAGGTMTGALTLAADPVGALQPVSLQYFQNNVPKASINVGDTPPASPTAGSLWWDSVGTQLYIYYNDGTSSQWVNTTNAGSGAAVAVSDTAPTNPAIGQLWFDSVGVQLYTYYFDGSSSQWVPVVNQSGSLAPAVAANVGRNLCHNSLFNVQQRGTGPWTTYGTYTADRWQPNGGSDTISFSIVPMLDADRAAIGDESARYAFMNAFTGNAAAGAGTFAVQRIESARRLSGKTVTVSFWARYTTGTPRLGITCVQNYGTGGSPSAADVLAGVGVTLTGAWARYSATFVIPSASGKTFGTNGDDSTQLELWYSAGANSATRAGIGVQSGTVQLWGVQLEVGSVATPLEKPDPQQDLAKCQRYYHVGWLFVSAYASVASVNFGGMGILPVTMRAAPTIAMTTNNNVNFTYGGSGSLPVNNCVYISGSSPAIGSTTISQGYTASADL